MTEIPEHLLKRSKQRRSALGLGGDEGEGDAAEGGAAATGGAPAKSEATAAPSAPVLAAPSPEAAVAVPAKPDPPFVAAAKSRRKVPYWMAPVLAFLPFWALLYANVLEVKEAEASGGLLPLGEELFATNCASCHGADGGGGVGPQLSGGEVLLTFPEMADQLDFVRNGSEAGVPYGDPSRAGGQHVGSGGMPGFGSSLTDEELAAVVCHERVTLSGGEHPECSEEGAGEDGHDDGSGSGAGNDVEGGGTSGGSEGGGASGGDQGTSGEADGASGANEDDASEDQSSGVDGEGGSGSGGADGEGASGEGDATGDPES